MATQYKINQGDTLSKIAQTQGTNINELLKANPNITDPNKIYAGSLLNLPATVGTEPAKAPSANPQISTDARNSLAPDTFKVNVGEVLPSDAFNPKNVPDTVTSNMSAIDQAISRYLTPSDTDTTTSKELAAVRAEKAKTQLKYRQASERLLEVSGGKTEGQFANEQKQLDSEYQKILADLSLQEQSLSETLDGSKEDLSTILGIGNYYSGLQSKQVSAQNTAQDNLTTYFNSFSGSPQIQSEIQSYKANGQITPGLATIIKTGQATGLSAPETIAMLEYQTDKVRQQQALEADRDIKNALANERLINAQEAGTKAQNFASTMGLITNTTNTLAAQGIKPGTLEYATAMANATAGSQTGLTAGETAGYSTLANIINNVSSLGTSLKELESSSDIKNIILNKTGASAQSLTSPQLALLTSKINQIAAPVARAIFGERGVLTEGDIQRVMSTLPSGASTSAVRNALYKEMLVNLRQGAINKLAIDASTGRNVVGVSPYVTQLVTGLDATISGLGGATGKSYTDPVTGKTYTY